MFDVVALGESLIDFTPNGTNAQGIELFARNPGGAPANVLAMNARLGGKTAFIGKVGKDGFGDFLRQTLVESGIDVSGLVIDEKIPTTLAFVQLDSKGDRSFTFYRNPGADVMLTSAEVNRNLIDDAAIFHFGSVSLTATRAAPPRWKLRGMHGSRASWSALTPITVRFCGSTRQMPLSRCRKVSSWRIF